MRWLYLPCLLIELAPGIAGAQTQVSVGLGVGTVRFAGGSSLSVASVSPNLQFTTPRAVATFTGALAALPDAVWYAQGRADVWVETPLQAGGGGPWRVGAEGIWSGTTRSDNGWTAALHGIGELLFVRPRWGIAAGGGPSAGWVPQDTAAPSVTALHLRARAWWHAGDDAPTWSVSVEPTRLYGAWFTDLAASVEVDRGPLDLTVWATARASRTYTSSAAASGLMQLTLTPGVSLELGAGSYLADPYQEFPRARFVTAGLRLRAVPRASRAPRPVLPPLIPEVGGDSVTVRFEMPGARAVAIAGDWNGWRPVPLAGLGDDVWVGRLALRRGTYHFNLLVDGKDWVVPGGVATVPDGLGGIVGVLIVN